MVYKIKIDYSTGNSFGSEDMIGYVDLEWTNLNVAKENLQRINEHYKQYNDVSECRGKKELLALYNENRKKDWFVYKPKLVSKLSGCAIGEKEKNRIGEENCEYVPDDYFAQYCIILKTDDGKDYQMSAFWCGYFEVLYSAEIEIDNSDMKILFN